MTLKEKLDEFDVTYKGLRKKEKELQRTYKKEGRSEHVKLLAQEIGEVQKQYKKAEYEAQKLLLSLPSGKGKDALILHYMAGKTYVKRAAEMGITERQLMRNVKKTLEEGEKAYEG